MIYLDIIQTERRKTGWKGFWDRSGRVPRRLISEEGEEILIFSLPERLRRKPRRLSSCLACLQRRYPPRGLCWYEEGLREDLAPSFWMPPVPEPAWIHRLWREEAFCPNLILVPPQFGEEGEKEQIAEEARWIEEVLGREAERLNGLLVLGCAPETGGKVCLADCHPYYQGLYEETGLPAVRAGSLGEGSFLSARGRTALLDARKGFRVPHRLLPNGLLYLDMTSEQEKARILAARRKDICYRSALNCLDTYVRTRYNTNRCKGETAVRRKAEREQG